MLIFCAHVRSVDNATKLTPTGHLNLQNPTTKQHPSNYYSSTALWRPSQPQNQTQQNAAAMGDEAAKTQIISTRCAPIANVYTIIGFTIMIIACGRGTLFVYFHRHFNAATNQPMTPRQNSKGAITGSAEGQPVKQKHVLRTASTLYLPLGESFGVNNRGQSQATLAITPLRPRVL